MEFFKLRKKKRNAILNAQDTCYTYRENVQYTTSLEYKVIVFMGWNMECLKNIIQFFHFSCRETTFPTISLLTFFLFLCEIGKNLFTRSHYSSETVMAHSFTPCLYMICNGKNLVINRRELNSGRGN